MRMTNNNLLVVEIERHGVANEVLSTRLKSELFVDLPHVILVKINS